MNNQLDTIIIGGGLSGLSIAHKLLLHNPRHNFLILEKEACTGGAIQSHHDQGFITEIGPHGFLDNCLESRQILTETGLDSETVKAPLIDFVRYVYLNGRLNLIPQTPIKILMAPLIPISAKLRVLGDFFKPPLEGEPTVAKWIHYRFGSALLPFVDAIYTGTYAGDYDKLTIDSVMPGVRTLEKEYGSVIGGLLKKRNKKRKGDKKTGKFQMPAMTSFATGMHRLPEKLTEQLSPGKNLLLNTEAFAIKRGENSWQIASSKGHFKAANLAIALPVNPALQLLKKIDSRLPEQSIPQAGIATIAFGFNKGERLPPGFGFLIPECESRFILGSLFSSNMFPDRAPENNIVFETLVGGRRHPEKLELSDETLTRKAFEDVREILRLPNDPVYSRVLRSRWGIPQLERNYPKLLKWRDTVAANNRGLYVCGFGWEGIGLNDMMKSGTRIAQAILSSVETSRPEDAAVKGVYF